MPSDPHEMPEDPWGPGGGPDGPSPAGPAGSQWGLGEVPTDPGHPGATRPRREPSRPISTEAVGALLRALGVGLAAAVAALALVIVIAWPGTAIVFGGVGLMWWAWRRGRASRRGPDAERIDPPGSNA